MQEEVIGVCGSDVLAIVGKGGSTEIVRMVQISNA